MRSSTPLGIAFLQLPKARLAYLGDKQLILQQNFSYYKNRTSHVPLCLRMLNILVQFPYYELYTELRGFDLGTCLGARCKASLPPWLVGPCPT